MPFNVPNQVSIVALSRIVPGYVGPCVRLRRQGGTVPNVEADIGFDVNGDVDHAAAIAHLADGLALRGVRGYDQTGAGLDWVQATTTLQPLYKLDQETGKPALFAVTATPDQIVTNGHFDLPAGIVVGTRDLSIYAVGRQNDLSANNELYTLSYQFSTTTNNFVRFFSRKNTLAATNNNQTGWHFTTALATQGRNSGDVAAERPYRPPNCSYAVLWDRYTASATSFGIGRWFQHDDPAMLSFTGLAGGKFLSTNNPFPSSIAFRGGIIARAHSDAERDAVIDGLDSLFGINSLPAHLLLTEGDSISAGQQNSFDRRATSYCWPWVLLETELGGNVGDWQLINLARSGGNFNGSLQQAIGTQTEFGVMRPDKIDRLASITAFTGRKVLVLFGGTNDLAAFDALGQAAGAGTTVYNRLASYVAAVQAAVPDLEIWVCTMMPRQLFSAAAEAERLIFNALVRANAFGADGIIDIATAVDWTAGSYLTYTQDGTHANIAGNAVIAQTVNSAMNPPLVPGVLTLDGVTITTISVSWTDGTGLGTVSPVLEINDGNGWSDLATESPTTATGLTPGALYQLRVRFADAGGQSGYSNTREATTALPPTNIGIEWTAEKRRLHWTANS